MGGGDDRSAAWGCLVVVVGVVVVLGAALVADLRLQAGGQGIAVEETAIISRQEGAPPGDGVPKPYTVVQAEDLSYSGRTRHRWRIVSTDARTFAERAATVIKAAQDLRIQAHTQEAYILLEASAKHLGKGYVLAMADYVPDSPTPWQVQSSDLVIKQPLDKKQLNYIFLKPVK